MRFTVKSPEVMSHEYRVMSPKTRVMSPERRVMSPKGRVILTEIVSCSSSS